MRVARKNLLLYVVATVAAIGVLLGGTSPVPAIAAGPSDGFDASKIIDDALFYDGNAMTAPQVQAFLNQRVPQCWLGRPGYEVGKAVTWGGVRTTLASKCTKDYVSPTQSRAANAYCAAYAGGGNETAAQIIQKVGKACGISQRVLLITLEKEQSLISDPWPNNEQYFRAMGYACPDSGPGGTANCDPTLGGFFQQVYRAAWQLKVYRAFPNSYNYKPFQNNYIQWHPNASCGGSTVNIQNWATAALYIYTPYRPNQAALNAGWGTGDGCSSYGNRNFYNFYKSWFGAPTGGGSQFEIHSQFQPYYNANRDLLGLPAARATTNAGGAVEQRFARGTLYWSAATGVGSVSGGIRTQFEAAGGPGGVLGLPVGHEVAERGWIRQNFQRGVAYWSSATDVGIVRGGIHEQLMKMGGPAGLLGLPIGNESTQNGGTVQRFARGAMYWTPKTNVTWTLGGIGSEFARLGGVSGKLGYPLAPEKAQPGYVGQDFTGGAVYWSPETNANGVLGGIYLGFVSAGGPSGALGIPTTGEVSITGGVRQEFKRGTAFWSAPTDVGIVQGGIRSSYLARGGPAGPLGFPIESEVAEGAWVRQEFNRGTAYWSQQTDVVFLEGGIRSAYLEQGGSNSLLGRPVTSEQALRDGARQDFEGGSAFWNREANVSFVRGGIRSAYLQIGGPDSGLGYPIGVETASNGWVTQEFQRGTAYWSSATDVVFTQGAIRTAHIAQGQGAGPWGYPTTSEAREAGGVRQEFEHGTARWQAGDEVLFAKK